MKNKLCEITTDASTNYFYLQKPLGTMEIIDLLWAVRTAKDRIPSIQSSESDRLLGYSRTMIPVSASSLVRLFQSMPKEEYDNAYQAFADTPSQEDVCVKIDYDSDALAIISWYDNELVALEGSLKGVLSAYGGSIIRRNSKTLRLNNDRLRVELEQLCSVTTLKTCDDVSGFEMKME